MRLRKKQWARPELEQDSKVILAPAEQQGRWQELFGNEHPVHLELGCGRGRFIATLAELNQDINYIAVDTYDEVLVRVLRRINENQLANVRIIPMNIAKIDSVFAQDEVARIYINFCNPWPSNRHHQRRLTHPGFLRLYKTFLNKGSEIWFKTDDDMLFAASLKYFQEEGFTEIYKTSDLHRSGFAENIMTEYEEKFSNQGIQIKFAKFVF
jgi:tRNA (guanine-N7-)-methyltransferase